MKIIFMLKGLATLFGMSTKLEEEDDGLPRKIEEEDDEEEEEEEQIIEKAKIEKPAPKAVVSKKSGPAKAKKERKPRIARNPYTPRALRVTSTKLIPIDVQNKGTKRIQRTKTATFATREGKLVVTVKKGRGTKEFEYDLVACRQDLPVMIKKEMEESQINTLDATRLAIHFPSLYWNSAHLLHGSVNKIDQMLQETGIPTGQRREK